MDEDGFRTRDSTVAANYFCHVLTNAFGEIYHQIDDIGLSKGDKVKLSLRNISEMYRTGLSLASSSCRSNWDDPANRCAYVFVYFMHHSYLVYISLQQNLPDISRSLRNKNSLEVCSIGGGPGSDLVGLTRFLRDTNLFPPSLQCHVLDLFPNWKDAWDTIYNQLPEKFNVTYGRCDIVRDRRLPADVLKYIRKADMLTLVKSFSAVAAFFRKDQKRGELLRAILRELKPECLVLYIDNEYPGDTFLKTFASPAGLHVVFEYTGKIKCSPGQFSHILRNYCRILDYRPMCSCDVTIRLLRKNKPVHTGVQENYLPYPSTTPHRQPSTVGIPSVPDVHVRSPPQPVVAQPHRLHGSQRAELAPAKRAHVVSGSHVTFGKNKPVHIDVSHYQRYQENYLPTTPHRQPSRVGIPQSVPDVHVRSPPQPRVAQPHRLHGSQRAEVAPVKEAHVVSGRNKSTTRHRTPRSERPNAQRSLLQNLWNLVCCCRRISSD